MTDEETDLGDNRRVLTKLRDEGHVANGGTHDNEQLLIVHPLGTDLVEPLVNQLANHPSYIFDGNFLEGSEECFSLLGHLEGPELAAPRLPTRPQKEKQWSTQVQPKRHTGIL